MIGKFFSYIMMALITYAFTVGLDLNMIVPSPAIFLRF